MFIWCLTMHIKMLFSLSNSSLSEWQQLKIISTIVHKHCTVIHKHSSVVYQEVQPTPYGSLYSNLPSTADWPGWWVPPPCNFKCEELHCYNYINMIPCYVSYKYIIKLAMNCQQYFTGRHLNISVWCKLWIFSIF